MKRKLAPPEDKGMRQLFDLAVHTKRTLRKNVVLHDAQPDMVKSARLQIFLAYKGGDLAAAEQRYSGYLDELTSWVSQKLLSPEEAGVVKENLLSFIEALRKSNRKKAP